MSVGLHMNARTQGFPAESVAVRSMLFTLSVSGLWLISVQLIAETKTEVKEDWMIFNWSGSE